MQNPPPGPQNSAPPAAQPPAGTPASGSGIDPKVAAALSYIWIVGVIFFFLEKENKFVRFHAMQSILFGVANSVIMVVLLVVAFVLTFAFGIGGAMVGGVAGTLVSMLVWVIWLLFWLIAMALILGLVFAAVKAYQGHKLKLPIIGNIAEGIVEK
ncbi:MAG TPA: hypothetical protein VNO50_03265 [Pyrinomonadaceae bacterium]|nr:hypothetical protein [Pyrinomonadaceae bacterium]